MVKLDSIVNSSSKSSFSGYRRILISGKSCGNISLLPNQKVWLQRLKMLLSVIIRLVQDRMLPFVAILVIVYGKIQKFCTQEIFVKKQFLQQQNIKLTLSSVDSNLGPLKLVSVFVCSENDKFSSAVNAVKRLKTLRHPSVVTFADSGWYNLFAMVCKNLGLSVHCRFEAFGQHELTSEYWSWVSVAFLHLNMYSNLCIGVY